MRVKEARKEMMTQSPGGNQEFGLPGFFIASKQIYSFVLQNT
jgi:hypothetical protein